MKYTLEQLQKKATNTFDFLIGVIVQADLVNTVEKRYYACKGFCSDENPSFKIRKLTQSDKNRILFEILCFLIYGVCVQSKNFILDKTIFKRKTDEEGMKSFNDFLLILLSEYIKKNNLDCFCEIEWVSVDTLEYKYGDKIDFVNRVMSYFRKGSDSFGYFCKNIGLAIDPPNYPILETAYWEDSVRMLKICKGILTAVFKRAQFIFSHHIFTR